MSDKKNFIKKMRIHAESLRPSTDRAQCLRMAQMVEEDKTGSNFRTLLIADHRSLDGARRAAKLALAAGCAEEKKDNPKYYGAFKFFDEADYAYLVE